MLIHVAWVHAVARVDVLDEFKLLSELQTGAERRTASECGERDNQKGGFERAEHSPLWRCHDSTAVAGDHGRGASVADERVRTVKTEPAVFVVRNDPKQLESVAGQRGTGGEWHHEPRCDRQFVQYRRP